MDAGKPKDIPKQGIQPHDQDTTMELTNTKGDSLRNAKKGPAKTPGWENRNIYVQTHKNDDEPAMEDRRMVSRREPTLQETAAVEDGIMAQHTQKSRQC